MRPRFQISVALLLCFLATGSEWDLIQTFAWGRMMAEYSRTMPLKEAVTETFTGKMCELCRLAARARDQERPKPGVPETKIESKVLLYFQTVPPVVVAAPSMGAWRQGDSPALTAERSAPPVPPPRAVA